MCDKETKFKRWLDFMLLTRKREGNKETLSNYFFLEFGKSTSDFYAFLNYLKNTIKTTEDEELKVKIADGYIRIISNICDRLSVHAIKRELDDLCFKIKNPEEYERISKKLAKYRKKEQKIIEKITNKLIEILDENNFKYELKGRYKTNLSVFEKTKKKNQKPLELKDIFGFRIILDSNKTEECFEVVNLFHDNFMPVTSSFKDYITIPKINGYQSIHTGLTKIIDNLDIPIEVQIRTRAMHEFAQEGIAAHWVYSQDKKSKLATEKEKKVIDHIEKMTKGEKDDLVYFFSQDGDIFELEKGSTALDFAYRIHTNIGNYAKSVTVNGQEKELKYSIQNGDKVTINTSEEPQIQSEWLKFIKTKHARKQIEEKLRH